MAPLKQVLRGQGPRRSGPFPRDLCSRLRGGERPLTRVPPCPLLQGAVSLAMTPLGGCRCSHLPRTWGMMVGARKGTLKRLGPGWEQRGLGSWSSSRGEVVPMASEGRPLVFRR